MKKYFDTDVDINDMKFLSPQLLMVFASLNQYCAEKGLPIRITSMVRPLDSISQTRTHQEGRALDLKTTHYDHTQLALILRFLEDYDKKHNVGAISRTTGKSRLGVYHMGTGPHIHLQVRR